MGTFRFNPTGTLNKDLDPRYLNEGNYRDANNIRPITDDGGSTMAIEPVKGTEQKIPAITVSSQNKVYWIVDTNESSFEFRLKIYDESGALKYNFLYNVGSDATNAIFTQTVGSKSQTLDKYANVNTYTPVDSNGIGIPDTVAIEFENNKDWTLEIEELSNNPVKEYYIHQEELSGGYNTGLIYWIGRREYLDRLYVWGTTCNSDNGGTGEIGLIQRDFQGNISYTRILRSKELNFSTLWQIDPRIEENDFRTSLYWTDNQNELRTLTHQSIGGDDFALSFNGGSYDYGSIKEQTKLIPTALGLKLEFTNQLQSGGAIKSGTWRYSVRLLTDDLAATAFSTLTGQVPVFSEEVSQANASRIRGNVPDSDTSKVNELFVENIDDTRFFFIELAAVQYIGNTPTGYIIKREQISGETMTLRHTGNEANVRNLGNLTELINLQPSIHTAKNIEINQNRLFVSNIQFKRSGIDSELQSIANNITVTEGNLNIEGVGLEQTFAAEFLVPDRVYNNKGYCPGETYRFGGRFIFTDGSLSKVFHVEDYQFTLDANTQLTKPTAGNTIQNPNIKYPIFQNINIPANLRDEIIGFQPMRVEMDESTREILTTGVGLAYGLATGSPGYQPGWRSSGSGGRHVFALVSPEIFFGGQFIEFQSGDKVLIRWGESYNSIDLGNTGVGDPGPEFIEYDGEDTSRGYSEKNVLDVLNTGFSTERKTILTYNGNEKVIPEDSAGAIVSLDSNTLSYAGDQAAPIMYYKRPRTNKFGSIESSTYIPCDQPVLFDDFGYSGSLSLFGGDCYIQKSIIKVGQKHPVVGYFGVGLINARDRGTMVSFYSVNRVNSQLANELTGDGLYPQTGKTLDVFLNSGQGQSDSYDKANNFQDGIQTYSAYNPNRPEVNRAETRIYFSPIKPTNSFQEVYGDFLPLNFKDVDPTRGPINSMFTLNGELHHIQPRAFTREYVNPRGLINPEDSTSVVIGSNEVLAKKEQVISTYGTDNKWSVVIGRSTGGNDVAYWFNAEYAKMIRFGYDGTVPVSDVKGLNSFFANNADNLIKFDNPVHKGGVHGVWDERFREVVYTFGIPKLDEVQEWNSTNIQTYGVNPRFIPAGEVFYYDNTIFETTGFVIVDLNQSNAVYDKGPYGNPDKWKIKRLDNDTYFNNFTIGLNEFKNGFTTFYDFTPSIYMNLGNFYFSENPNDNSIHIHNEGKYLVFYGTEYEGNIKGIINKRPDFDKVWQAISVQCEDTPFRVEFETKDHESYLTFFDFRKVESSYRSAIKQDSKLSGVNDRKSEKLRGTYIFIDFLFEPQQYQKLFNFVGKGKESPRTVNT